ncbi:MAG TPA: class I SAM-dependent methyltransferase [Solirubrobacterales bacterium]|jgi:SAM-dependent methyltransferase|nr:class I SAM-dependent methyltransferase [Solirubrobacterales bacterium]
MSDAVANFAQVNRAVWTAGNWDAVADIVSGAGSHLIDTVGVDQGTDVLDIGTGSGGSVAIPAALRGGDVIGSDLVPELLDAARRRGTDAGVDIEWVEANAEELPFEDASFDRVLSTFGHMFAPRHAMAAAEMARVTRPGGIVGFTTWTPVGMVGEMFPAVGSRMPTPPEHVQPPSLWGSEHHVREMFEPHGLDFEFSTKPIQFKFPTLDGLVNHFEENFGPVVMAKAVLGDQWPGLRAELAELFSKWNRATDGSAAVESVYLLSVGRKPA